MTRDPEARRLESQLLEWIAVAPAGFAGSGATRAARYGLEAAAASELERRFESLALDLFAFQFERIPVYRGYCQALDRTPSRVRRSLDVPALPVDAFRRVRVAAFPAQEEVRAFRTSGTTGDDSGTLHLDGLELYDLALERGFEHHVLPDRETIRMLVLVAHPDEAPHSSLSYMLERVRRRWGAPGSGTLFRDGEVRWHELRAALETGRDAREPVCLLGTAFGWVHVLDAAARESFRVELAPGSRLFETGGYKGRSRELARADLVAAIERTFAIPSSHVVSEYGMTEMGSQLYSTSLRQALLGEPPLAAAWSYPAWLRPRIVDSESGAPRELEEALHVGLLAHHDLANRAAVAHLLTADLAAPRGASFELRGRCPRADLRGCGLVHEEGSVAP